MMLTGAGKAGGAPAFSLTNQSSAGSTSNATTTIDYGTLSYGSGNTRVIVAVTWYTSGAAQTITGITIGGVALAQVSGAYVQQAPGAFSPNIDIWESTGSLAGTSGDVQVTFSAVTGFGSAVALYNLVTTTPAASAATNASTSNATSLSTTMTVPAGGGGIVVTLTGNGKLVNYTSNATLDVAVSVSGNNHNFGHTTATGALTPTGNWSPADPAVMASAAWGP
jgi:hypothetical protein